MYKQILIPTDGSEISQRAAEQAINLAKHVGASARALFVIDTRVLPGSHPILPESMAPHYFSLIEEMRRAGQDAVDAVIREGAKQGVSCKGDIVEGIPSDCILRAITDGKVDLLVMGTHGRTGLAALMIGSTAQAIVHSAKVPVLLVR